MFLLLIPCNKAIACHKEKKYCRKKKAKKNAIRRKELFFCVVAKKEEVSVLLFLLHVASLHCSKCAWKEKKKVAL